MMLNNSMFSRLHRRSGFTLIELLVVVSIIALLISILLPSLKRAREQAKAAVCMAGLKGLATASVTYATDDEQESSVPVHPHTTDKDEINDGLDLLIPRMAYGGKSGRGKFKGNAIYWGTGLGRGPGTRPMNAFLYKEGFRDWYQADVPDLKAKFDADAKLDLAGFRCPSDTGHTGGRTQWFQDSKLSAYDFFGTSYYANVLWVGSTGGGCKLESNSAFLRPLSRVPNPANTIYFSETAGRRALWAPDAQPTNIQGCGDGVDDITLIKGWHKRDWTFQTCFVDAHAEVTIIHGFKAPQLAEYPGYDFEYWKCVIFRGNNWAMDTLPSPTMQTNIKCP